MKCSNCGAENPEGKKFCGNCGLVLSQTQQQMQFKLTPPQQTTQYQPQMQPAPVDRKLEKKFNGSLAILVILVFVFFPAAIIYYFMRREVVQRCYRCNAELPNQASVCPMCTAPLHQSYPLQTQVPPSSPTAPHSNYQPSNMGSLTPAQSLINQPPKQYPQYSQMQQPTSLPQIESQQPTISKFCKYCGNTIKADSAFCEYCGKAL